MILVITLGHMLAFLGVGLVVGSVAWLLAPDRETSGVFFYTLVSIGGAFVGGFVGRGIGLSGPYELAGLILSFVGAMIFVGTYHLARTRLSLP